MSTFLISILLIVYGSFRSLNMEQEAREREKEKERNKQLSGLTVNSNSEGETIFCQQYNLLQQGLAI